MGPDQTTQRRWYGQVQPWADGRVRRHEGAREFERVERVAARELLDPQERRRAKLEWVADAAVDGSAPIERGLEPQRSIGMGRAASARPNGGGSPGMSPRWAIRSRTGRPASRRTLKASASRLAGSAHCASSMAISNAPRVASARKAARTATATALRVGRLLHSCVDRVRDILVTQRPPKHGAMDLRKGERHRCKGGSQQVDKRGVGIVGLGLDGPCIQDSRTRGRRRCHSGPQQACLADSGRPFDQDGQRINVGWSDPGNDARKLLRRARSATGQGRRVAVARRCSSGLKITVTVGAFPGCRLVLSGARLSHATDRPRHRSLRTRVE